MSLSGASSQFTPARKALLPDSQPGPLRGVLRGLLYGMILSSVAGNTWSGLSAGITESPEEPSYGAMIDQGSVAVGESVAVREGDILTLRNDRRSVSLPSDALLWTDGIVPYSIDPLLSRNSVEAIEAAISHWNQASAITLLPLDQVTDPTDHVYFQPGEGCASWVGRRGGRQAIWVADICTTGSMMHEIGHALGLEHEHTRPDREQYIRIHWENIAPDKRHNFDVAPAGSRMLGPYDFASIMHYGPRNFSSNGQSTITQLFGPTRDIGQRVAPSPGDLAAIARLYSTDLTVVSHISVDGQGAEARFHVSNNQDQGAHGIVLTVSLASGRVLSYDGSSWLCKASRDDTLVCTLPRLGAATTSVLTLAVDTAMSTGGFIARLGSKTLDSDPVNNVDTSGNPVTLAAATAADSTPAIAAPVTNALEDPVVPLHRSSLSAGAAFWSTPILLLLLLYRQAGRGVYRQTSDRIE